MTDAIHEQLSAFLDGELSAAESELLLKRVERDPELAARLKRYMLSSEALRAPTALGPSRDFGARVAAAIDQESIPARARSLAGQWLKPVAGGAIAAGAAALALVSLQPQPGETPESTPLAGVQSPVAAQTVPDATGPAVVVADTGSDRFIVPAANANRAAPRVINQGRLANYVVAHSEYSSPLGRRNVLTGLVAEEGGVEEFAIEVNPDGSVTVRPKDAPKNVEAQSAPNR
jgi:sigma-E factor negative regulatory protein RseA